MILALGESTSRNGLEEQWFLHKYSRALPVKQLLCHNQSGYILRLKSEVKAARCTLCSEHFTCRVKD